MKFMAFELIGVIGVIIAVVTVIFSATWVVFGFRGLKLGFKYLSMKGRNDSARAIEILKERYAKGEITKEQYERMIRELEQHP